MLTTGTVSNESFGTNSSSSEFPLLRNANFSCNNEKEQSATNKSAKETTQEKSPDTMMSDHMTSSTSTLIPNQFSALFPSTASLTPPSPADSGVVADSKLELNHITQDMLNSRGNVGGDERLKLSPNSIMLSGIESASTTDNLVSGITSSNLMNIQDCNVETSKIISNDASADKFGFPNKFSENNCVTISQELATIWSPPTVENKPVGLDSSIQLAMLQALQQQQQQLENWSDSGVGSPAKPPPGLGSLPLLQKHLQAKTGGSPLINGLQQKLPLRRSQSVMLNRTNVLSNASFLQRPGVDSYDSFSEQLLNESLSSQTPAFSPWSNASMQGSISSTNLSTLASLNSPQVSAGSNAFPKFSLAPHLASPPKLHRSISTPAQHTTPFNIAAVPPSLDDNPYFKHTMPGLNGHVPVMGGGNALNFSDFESTLNEIMKSNTAPKHSFLQAHQSTRGLGKWKELSNDTIYEEGLFAPSFSAGTPSFLGDLCGERYSRKVFVGGLPPDIDEDEIRATFIHFGSLVVDWPHKAESKSYFPPKGYAFLLFKEEMSVQNLIRCCLKEGDKLYLRVSSPTIRDKPVQIRPWKLTDSDFVLDGSQSLDPRKTVFVGGVPRPLRAFELAILMDRLYGGVCYAGIDVDPDLKYPKGAGRVAFSNQQSYIAAISARFAHLQHGDIDKRVEVKPYVLDDQHCDECQGTRCAGRFAPFFCANISCLRYYCDQCWVLSHNRIGMESHRPLVKEGAERFARSTIGRW